MRIEKTYLSEHMGISDEHVETNNPCEDKHITYATKINLKPHHGGDWYAEGLVRMYCQPSFGDIVLQPKVIQCETQHIALSITGSQRTHHPEVRLTTKADTSGVPRTDR